MMGGITRMKYHLAKIPGHEVDICPKSTPEIMHISNKALEDTSLARDYNKAKKSQFARRGGKFGCFNSTFYLIVFCF
jgi:hypothetical protein